ncbi:carbohydrate ABC transporter permease [Streptomyces fuscigenes]|uniref:carbohydrate ABC transporter permease n=1 Tax=Streptomyces fuscigenes TaxID=1528880 RepID=UPI001F395CC9|nr:carbohydrate ABC transporter permease [Streptomyces fuscigenes]MCF3963559.1 carbohydrate ABC transporter permease [Streptomyces fuscigenes]
MSLLATGASRTTAAPAAGGSGARPRLSPGRIGAWVFIIVVLIVTIFPFYWILRTAFSNNVALPTDPSSFLPVDFTWGAFKRALGLASQAEAQAQGGSGAALDTPLFLRNSIIYATVQTALVVFCSAMAAYAFSRLRWRGRNTVFNILLGALMVPAILTLLPNFIFVRDIHQLNSFTGLILPGAFFSAFNIFFLRQFMLGLSTEVEEAAIVDGASRMRIFFTITLPMTAAPIATLSLLTFINTWNDYFWPLLATNDDHARPLTLALGVFKQSSPQAAPDWAGLMAATMIAALPMLALFMVFGRRIVNSIGFTGIK